MALRQLSIALAGGLLLAAGLSSCMKYEKKANSPTSGTATLVCDNTFENIFEQEVDVFEYQYPEAHILVRYGTQSEALDSLFSLNTRTVVISRDLTQDEKRALKAKYKQERKTNVVVRTAKIAVDAVALIVNPANTVNKVTVNEVADILSGETPNWNDLEPSKLGAIKVVVDKSGSSLATYLTDSILGGRPLAPNVYEAGSIRDVFKAVEADKNAIGVLGVSWITSDMDAADISSEDLAKDMLSEGAVTSPDLTQKVKVLAVNRNDDVRAYKPYQQNIFDGTYPFFRQIYMVTTASTSNVAGGFYSFVTGPTGQKIILKTGILPAKVSIQQVELVGGEE